MSIMLSKHIIVGIFSKVWTFVGIGKVAKVWAEFMLTENSLKIALLTDENEKERGSERHKCYELWLLLRGFIYSTSIGYKYRA